MFLKFKKFSSKIERTFWRCRCCRSTPHFLNDCIWSIRCWRTTLETHYPMNNRTTIEQSQRLPISFQNRPKYDNFRRLPKRPLHPPPTSIKMSIGSTKRPYLTATKKSPYPFLLFSDSIFPVIPTYDGRKKQGCFARQKSFESCKAKRDKCKPIWEFPQPIPSEETSTTRKKKLAICLMVTWKTLFTLLKASECIVYL